MLRPYDPRSAPRAKINLNTVLDVDLQTYDKGRARLPANQNVGGTFADKNQKPIGRFYLAADASIVFSFDGDKRSWAVSLHDLSTAVTAADELYCQARARNQLATAPKATGVARKTQRAAKRAKMKAHRARP